MSKILVTVLLSLTLTSCTEPSNSHDYPAENLPGITVSQKNAKVGEPITVTLTGEFKFSAGSRRPEHTLKGLELGACIGSPQPSIEVGICGYEDSTEAGPVQFLNGTTYKESYGDVVMKPGETLKLKHTFVFTSTQPAAIVISSTVKLYVPEYHPAPSLIKGAGVTVTFKR